MQGIIEFIVRYYNEHQLERFVPWKRRKCEHCGYPLSEKVTERTTASGRKKKVYCCNLCYDLKENRIEVGE